VAGDIRKDAASGTDRRFLVGTRPSIRFEDKERGLRGLVKLLFDARRARQKVGEGQARSKWAHVKKGNEINSHARSVNLMEAKDLVPTRA
jgi:hypothetical protein